MIEPETCVITPRKLSVCVSEVARVKPADSMKVLVTALVKVTLGPLQELLLTFIVVLVSVCVRLVEVLEVPVEPKVDGAEPMTQSPVEVAMMGPLIELIERKAPLSKARIEIELAELGAEIEAL